MPLAAIPAFVAANAVAIGATAAVVGTGYSIYAGERANKASKAYARAEQARNDLQAARQRRDAIREARMAYASSQQSAENQGVAQSSSALGGQASVSSQLNSNLSFLDQYGFYTDQAGKALQAQRTWDFRAHTADQVAGLGISVFNHAPDIADTFSSIFKKR